MGNEHNFAETFIFLKKRGKGFVATTRRDTIVLKSLTRVAQFLYENIGSLDRTFVRARDNKVWFDAYLLQSLPNAVHFFTPFFGQYPFRIRTKELGIFSNTMADEIDGVHIPKIVEDYVQKLA